MYDLTGFQRDLLYVVAVLGDPKGLAIKDLLEDNYGSDINFGRLYPALDTFVEKGLVEKGQKDDRTDEYTLTGLGREVLEDRWEWEDKVTGNQL